jgi:voltage-gated potassium channel
MDLITLRKKLYIIIFGADTPAGKLFDVLLIVSIIVSVLAVMLDSIESIREAHRVLLGTVEWFFTLLFTVEYGLRIFCSREPKKYVTSFFGMVDLLAILPTYLSLIYPGGEYLLVIRLLRVLRVFRILKLAQYVAEANLLIGALRASSRKIFVFFYTVISLVTVFGSLMYVIESEQNGFTSIPKSIYWAIVTLTTVGYGDIAPETNLGQTLAAVIMILGYSIIAVPTGIVTVEMSRLSDTGEKDVPLPCDNCSEVHHDNDAHFCKQCGNELKKL